MEALPLHPKIVHLPMALAVLMPLLTGGILLAVWRGWFAQRTWTIVFALQALLFATGLVAMRSGESDEDVAERVVAEAAIERHEAAAEGFVQAGGLVLALSLLPLVLRGRRLVRIAGLTTLAGTLVVAVVGYRVGSAGGELVYRHGAGSAFAARVDADHDR